MPNRVIRDSILTSRQVARLDWFQQALFVRLILGCDDYGRYYGAPDIICGHLFSTSSGVTQELVAEGLGTLHTGQWKSASMTCAPLTIWPIC